MRDVLKQDVIPCVEVGWNTFTVIPASCKRQWKGNPVGSDETVMYGYKSSATLTTQIAVQITDPSSRQRGRSKTKSKATVWQKKGKGKRKIRSWAPKGCPCGIMHVTHRMFVVVLERTAACSWYGQDEDRRCTGLNEDHRCWEERC
jgi:hypothetical protein